MNGQTSYQVLSTTNNFNAAIHKTIKFNINTENIRSLPREGEVTFNIKKLDGSPIEDIARDIIKREMERYKNIPSIKIDNKIMINGQTYFVAVDEIKKPNMNISKEEMKKDLNEVMNVIFLDNSLVTAKGDGMNNDIVMRIGIDELFSEYMERREMLNSIPEENRANELLKSLEGKYESDYLVTQDKVGKDEEYSEQTKNAYTADAVQSAKMGVVVNTAGSGVYNTAQVVQKQENGDVKTVNADAQSVGMNAVNSGNVDSTTYEETRTQIDQESNVEYMIDEQGTVWKVNSANSSGFDDEPAGVMDVDIIMEDNKLYKVDGETKTQIGVVKEDNRNKSKNQGKVLTLTKPDLGKAAFISLYAIVFVLFVITAVLLIGYKLR